MFNRALLDCPVDGLGEVIADFHNVHAVFSNYKRRKPRLVRRA